MGIAIAALCGCSVDDAGNEPGDGDLGGNMDAGSDAPPQDDYCGPVEAWPPAWTFQEEELLALVNFTRSQGADCGSEGSFGPADPLVMDPALTCAARAHSLDMYERDYFDHVNPDGQSSSDRMELAGYEWQQVGENIAFAATNVENVMIQWMSSPGHCANIMNPSFVHLGIGYHGNGRLWTQVFGTPR